MENSETYAVAALDERRVATMPTAELIAETDRAVMRVLRVATSKKKSEAAKRAAQEALRAYCEGQEQMFRMKGLPPTRARKEAIVAGATEDGRTVWRIVPRRHEIGPVDFGDIVAAPTQGHNPNTAMAHEVKRGRYNDGHRLIDMTAASLDRSEAIRTDYEN